MMLVEWMNWLFNLEMLLWFFLLIVKIGGWVNWLMGGRVIFCLIMLWNKVRFKKCWWIIVKGRYLFIFIWVIFIFNLFVLFSFNVFCMCLYLWILCVEKELICNYVGLIFMVFLGVDFDFFVKKELRSVGFFYN